MNLEDTLVGACQILDTIKSFNPKDWTEWDESVRVSMGQHIQKLHDTRPQPKEEPNGFDLDGNPIVYGLSGGPTPQPKDIGGGS